MASQAPPTIPPRPTRAKSPHLPAIPPRPAARTKSPGATGSEASELEPAVKTIPSSTELHAPVALPVRPVAVPRAESETSITSHTPSYSKPLSEDREEGIPQIGRRVPMYPNAGDVQAPSPTETPSNSKKKHVYREEWEMNEGAYGQKRRETPYSMSSTDLNAVVAQSASPAVGLNENECGVPDEEVGYMASDQYHKALSRSHSPVQTRDSTRLSIDGSRDDFDKTDEDGDVIHLEDPLHGPGYFRRGNSSHVASRAESIIGEEIEEEDGRYSILAEDEVLKRQQGQYMQAAIYTPSYTPRHPRSRPHSSMRDHVHDDIEGASLELSTDFKSQSRDSYRTPYEELSPADENAKPLFPESDEEKEKDEPLKNPLLDKLKRPLIQEHRFPSNDVWEEAPDHAQLEATIESPPSGTTGVSITEEDHEVVPEKKSDEPKLRYIKGQPHEHYEPGDEQEHERKQKDAARKAIDYRLDLQDLPQDDDRLHRLHKNRINDDAAPEASSSRRGFRKKFPSNDIWEDVPPSLDLEEELEPSTLLLEKERATTGDISAVSEISARPTTGAPIEGLSSGTKPTPPARPSVPARPHREKKWPPATIHEQPATIHEQPEPAVTSPDKKSPPSMPDRPKPSVPARPGKLSTQTPSEEKSVAPEPKPKPPIPPRTGGKIAALKAGLLGDLESKLRLGAALPKKEEKKEEESVKEEPLQDVRKFRIKGPRGRKLPTMEEKLATNAVEQLQQHCEIVGVWTVFTVDELFGTVLMNTAAAVTESPASSGPTSEADPAERKANVPTSATEIVEGSGTPITTPPGVTGTDEQAATVEPKVEPEPSKAEAETEFKPSAAEGYPTLILSSEHPEDSSEESFEEVEKPKEG